MLPSIQNVLEMQGRPNFTVVDRASNGPHPGPRTGNSTVEDQKSSGRQRNPEVRNSQKSWENRPKTCFMQENSRLRSRESSVDSYTDEQNRDTSGTTTKMHFSLPSFSQPQSSCTRFIDFFIGHFFARHHVSPPLLIKYS